MTSESRYSWPERVGIAGAALTAVGAFLPWQAGAAAAVDGPGLATLFLAFAALGVVPIVDWDAWGSAIVGAVGGLVLAVGAWSFSTAGADAAPGVGLWLTAAGGSAVVAAGLWGFLQVRRGP